MININPLFLCFLFFILKISELEKAKIDKINK